MRVSLMQGIISAIRKENPYKYGRETLLLVSCNLLNALEDEVRRRDETLSAGAMLYTEISKYDRIMFHGLIIVQVPWLGDYEFEIRPPRGDNA